MAATDDRLRALVAPLVAEHEATLFDVERTGGKLIVTIDRADGVDIDTIAAVTRSVSRALDEAEPISGRYVLEVTSPGLERTLRDPDQYRWAIGKQVSLRVTAPDRTEAGERRVTGTLLRADDDGVTVDVSAPGASADVVELPYGSIQKGRTVVDWEAELRAGSSRSAAEPGSGGKRTRTPTRTPKGGAKPMTTSSSGGTETDPSPAATSGPSRRGSNDGADHQRVSNR